MSQWVLTSSVTNGRPLFIVIAGVFMRMPADELWDANYHFSDTGPLDIRKHLDNKLVFLTHNERFGPTILYSLESWPSQFSNEYRFVGPILRLKCKNYHSLTVCCRNGSRVLDVWIVVLGVVTSCVILGRAIDSPTKSYSWVFPVGPILVPDPLRTIVCCTERFLNRNLSTGTHVHQLVDPYSSNTMLDTGGRPSGYIHIDSRWGALWVFACVWSFWWSSMYASSKNTVF